MQEKRVIKQYAWRWLNLLLFVGYTFHIGLHWAQFSPINSSIAAYYNVPHALVEWTSGLYAVSYVLFVGPGLYVMDKFKLRHVIIFLCLLSTTGAWMKAFSVAPDRFVFLFIAQFFIAISYTFLFGGSAHLIATWFGVYESSRASALSFIGDQIGSAFSFIIPVMIVHKSADIVVWESSLRRLHLVNASTSTLFLLLVILLFKDKPKNPPSVIQTMKGEVKSETFLQSLPKMLKNRSFLMVLFWYGVCSGLLTTLGTVLGEIITKNYPDSYSDAGNIGFIILACAMLFSVMFGYFMDRTKKFKEVGITLSTGSFISFLVFTIALKMNNITYVYLSSVLIGIFMASVYACGIQIGIEILYPVPEYHCSGLMVFVMQFSSLIFLPIYSTVFRNYGDIMANSIFCVLTFVASIFAFLAPVKLNRQEAEQLGANSKELQEFLPNPKPHIIKY